MWHKSCKLDTFFFPELIRCYIHSKTTYVHNLICMKLPEIWNTFGTNFEIKIKASWMLDGLECDGLPISGHLSSKAFLKLTSQQGFTIGSLLPVQFWILMNFHIWWRDNSCCFSICSKRGGGIFLNDLQIGYFFGIDIWKLISSCTSLFIG